MHTVCSFFLNSTTKEFFMTLKSFRILYRAFHPAVLYGSVKVLYTAKSLSQVYFDLQALKLLRSTLKKDIFIKLE
eukprot:snap_masked-scaffold_25-processed-gene-1.15-mRNA-1 protein AED:1.00 eAED:1.00 QI:0/0/0/0/1/1/2/0/74